MRAIRRARRCEPASIRSWNFADSECANDLLDKIDIALQIAPITRDLPRGYRLVRLDCFKQWSFRAGLSIELAQSKSFENFVDRFRFNRDPDDSIAFFVAQRNVRRIRRTFSPCSHFFRRRSTRDLTNQFGRTPRRA